MKQLVFLSIFVMTIAFPDLAFSRDTSNTLICQTDEEAWLSTTLFFGRSISRSGAGDGVVSDGQWTEFRDAHITPRLADGYTLIEGKGYWKRSDTGELKQEQTKVLIVVHPRNQAFEEKLSEIIATYKAMFSQQSVLRSISAACVKF